MTDTFRSRLRPPSDLGLEFGRLLRRYPDLTEREIDRLVDLYPRLPMLELGLFAADDRLVGRLDAFRCEHRRRLRHPVSRLGIVLAVAALLIGWAVWPGFL